ncbi:MAG: ABC transporter C-terminal domain-containing protein [Clostridium sp.]
MKKKTEEAIHELETRDGEIDGLLALEEVYTNVARLVELNHEKRSWLRNWSSFTSAGKNWLRMYKKEITHFEAETDPGPGSRSAAWRPVYHRYCHGRYGRSRREHLMAVFFSIVFISVVFYAMGLMTRFWGRRRMRICPEI